MRLDGRDIARSVRALASGLGALWKQRHVDCRECVVINIRRILYCALTAMPVSLAHLVLFWFKSPSGPAEAQWRFGILMSHAVLLGLMLLSSVVAWKAGRRGATCRAAVVLQYAVVAVLLAAGVIIASIDQLVTTNITPYLAVCLIVGAAFLIRPLYAFLLFTAAFVAFCLAFGHGAGPAVALSNRVNALTASALGFGLSIAMWRHFLVESVQRRQIEAQSRELERMNRELQNMAFTDSLTGLPNRRTFDQAISRELAAIARGGAPAGIIEFDLDHFKEVNDTFGHFAGDEVLRQAARLVSDSIRKSDLFARYGGEEFILMLPETPLAGARQVAEKLRERIENSAFSVEGREIRITASFGVAQLDTSPAESCYRMVDRALYRAKQKGRNRVEAAVHADAELPEANAS